MKSATKPSDLISDNRQQRDALLADVSVQGPAYGRALAASVDVWLTSLFPAADGIALVAVGGYGRRELAPGSDLDILLLHGGRRDVAEVADRLWYPIWDSGFRLDHSVRTIREVVSAADADVKVALGLLDARFVAGDRSLVEDLARSVEQRWRKRASKWIPSIAESVEARRAQFGPIAFLLEPDLKECHGGLRDANVDRAIRSVLAAVEDPAEVQAAADELFAVRVALHRVSGRSDDRLLLDYQDEVAVALGLGDADELMRRVAAAGRVISWHLDDLLLSASDSMGGRRSTNSSPVSVGPGITAMQGELHLTTVDADDPWATLLEIASAAAEQSIPIGKTSLQRLGDEVPMLSGPWSDRDRIALVSLLAQGAGAIAVFEALDRYDLVTRVLPEWSHVRSLPQRNAFHHFTVDRHLVEAAARAAPFCDRVTRPDLLLVGTWLHDIGKGLDGDHTDEGVQLVRSIGARMGFGDDDVETLIALVELHLLLPAVATSRDLGDPQAIAAVADAIGSNERLDLLHALTEVDSIATGASAWSPWKAELVATLVDRVRDWFAGIEPVPSDEAAAADAALVERAHGELLVEGRGLHLTVVAPDEPRLFSRVVGLLGLHGLAVRAAGARSPVSGLAISEYDVEPKTGRPPDWAQFGDDLAKARRGRLAIDARLRERAAQYGRLQRPQAAQQPVVRVRLDNDVSERATVIEVRAEDGIGLLYRITRTLADFHLDIRHAKALTLGHEVIDTFYVVTDEHEQITSAEFTSELERALLDAVRDGAN